MNGPKWIIASLTLLFSATVAFRDGDVRLAGSDRYGEGRVEVFFMGAWGTICQSGWDLNDAQVICRQSGFENGAQRTFIAARFGGGSGSVLLSDVECRGDEETLTQCDNTVWNANTCDHQGDVGVRCNAPNYEGCFPSARSRSVSTTISGILTFEGCYSYCSTFATRYLWMERGDTCVCGDSISGVTSQIEGCNTPCTGDDWICGGPDEASVHSARVNLPFAGSSGFPGRVPDNSIRDTWRFSPRGIYDYIYIQVHLFDIPSMNATDLVSNSNMFEVIDGSPAGEYLVSTTATEIEVTYPGTSRDEGGYLGFLFQFGQGTFCTPPQGIPNGIISTTSVASFTVGDYFRVTCEAGFRAFDRDVFCQADGTLSRPLSCVQQTGPITAESSMTNRPPPPVITFVPPSGKLTRTLDTRRVTTPGATGTAPPVTTVQPSESNEITLVILIVYIIGVAVVLVVSLIIVFCWVRRIRQDKPEDHRPTVHYMRRIAVNTVPVAGAHPRTGTDNTLAEQTVPENGAYEVVTDTPTEGALPSASSYSADPYTNEAELDQPYYNVKTKSITPTPYDFVERR